MLCIARIAKALDEIKKVSFNEQGFEKEMIVVNDGSSDGTPALLKKIDGIGMFLEQRLNQLEIYTYKQISQFDEAFIAKLGAALGFSEQTIGRDEWVKQARA